MFDTLNPTVGEKIRTYRRRRGESIVTFAGRIGVPRTTLIAWEMRSERPGPDDPRRIVYDRLVSRLRGLTLRSHEVCHILRRRKGIKISEITGIVGTSHVSIIAMEQGRRPCGRLLESLSS